jgi:hypothetical protein
MVNALVNGTDDTSKAICLPGGEPQKNQVEGMEFLMVWYFNEWDWAKEVAAP